MFESPLSARSFLFAQKGVPAGGMVLVQGDQGPTGGATPCPARLEALRYACGTDRASGGGEGGMTCMGLAGAGRQRRERTGDETWVEMEGGSRLPDGAGPRGSGG